jgi:hypothetical protein
MQPNGITVNILSKQKYIRCATQSVPSTRRKGNEPYQSVFYPERLREVPQNQNSPKHSSTNDALPDPTAERSLQLTQSPGAWMIHWNELLVWHLLHQQFAITFCAQGQARTARSSVVKQSQQPLAVGAFKHSQNLMLDIRLSTC